MRLVVAVALLFLGLGTVSAGEYEPAQRTQIERKLDSVASLIERSSAAKQIEASNVPAAKAMREEARALRAKAAAAYQADDATEAARLLDAAAKRMVEAVRQAAPDQITAGKRRADFDARLETVKVLLEAQKRVGNEKHAAGAGETSKRIEQLVEQARSEAAAGDIDKGRATLDRAYLTAKSAISGMRSGDTLVRNLEFATKEDEYRYELDRNDTHRMLIKLLVEDQQRSAAVDKSVQSFQDKAADLRRQAEALAQKQDFAGAVTLLEQSTAELVRAIRGAGVYIPG
jgi:hypothetical protein